MVRAPKPKPDPGNAGAFLPNGAAAKAGLNKSIHDAGWGVFLGILAHKADSAGRKLIPVDPRNTSRTCPRKDCAHVAEENRPTQEKFQCVRWGYTDRPRRSRGRAEHRHQGRAGPTRRGLATDRRSPPNLSEGRSHP